MSNIMINDTKMVVSKRIENEDVHFFGFVKSCTNMTQEMEEIANKFLDALFKRWTEYYDRIYWITHECEYRYESLKSLQNLAYKLIKENGIDPAKAKMSITAVCIFPRRKKAFWINTGDDMVYSYKGGKRLNRLGDEKKQLTTIEEQSIFSNDRNYTDKVEGCVVSKPKSFFVVTSESREYFEQSMQKGRKISNEDFNAFAYGKKNPIIIGEVLDS